MHTLAIILFWILVSVVLAQTAMVCRFAWVLSHGSAAQNAEGPVPAENDRSTPPKTAVILCLRGSDPFLPACVEALLDQDYPDYDVRVVVDRRDDPAWCVVEETVRRCGATNVEIFPLSDRRETCSLKCSSVLQAIAGLDESYEAVALLDADTVPHRRWLRELVAPLADVQVGAATGNRWYMPESPTMGALVRWVWNAAAVVQMYWYRIPWGGTLAVKTIALRQSDLLERWGDAFCEETMLFEALGQQGLRVAFVPSLMMVNREVCSLASFYRWVRRQLLTARLYHPHWAAVVGYGIITSLAPAMAIGAAAWGLWGGQMRVVAWAGGGLACYLAVTVPLLAILEWAVRKTVRTRGESTGWLSPSTTLKLLAAIPVTQVVYAAVLISTVLVRTVEWRGVFYRVDGPWNIRLIEYRPFEAENSATDSAASL